MNLADPELELIDPTPNVHSMFMHFDKTFFWTKLASRCIVKWSKRMYSCAGTCTYEITCGLCKITLSEPLLKLRPRKDLVETLLHEMIHAFLFVTNRDQDRDGHGPNFKAHMHRINRAAGLNISIYHDFHDEVKLYQTHWWRCDGPCQQRRPHFGIVRRTCNRPPGPSDYWWNSHKRNCGGTFIKIKEPEKPQKVAKEPKSKKTKAKPHADITKYVNNNNDKGINNKNNIPKDNVTKDTSDVMNKTNIGVKSNSSSTLVINKKNVIFNPQVTKPKPVVFTGSGQTITDVNKRTSSGNVLETVRNVWANKQIGMNNKKASLTNSNSSVSTPSKHKAESHTDSPPPKMKKIDDYFKSTASSMLKDLYGQDFKVTQSENKEKLIAVSTVTPKEELDFNTTKSKINEKLSTVVQVPEKRNLSLVSCPVCSLKIETSKINVHLDECLNKTIIDELSQQPIKPEYEPEPQKPVVNSMSNDKSKPKELHIIQPKPTVKKEKVIQNVKKECDNIIDLSNMELISDANRKRTAQLSSDQVDLIKPEGIKSETDKRNKDCRKSDSFLVPKAIQEHNKTIETKPTDLRVPQIKIEPSSSKVDVSETECPCCGDKLNTTVDEHLEECLSFLENDTTIPEEGASTSFGNETIVIDDDDDMFDESQSMNATGTKLPCPCCLKMVEAIDMNNHLDKCLK